MPPNRFQTVTTPTSPSSTDQDVEHRTPGLCLVLECDRLAAGGAMVPLHGVSRVVVGRGPTRAIRTLPDGAVRWDIPDAKLSGTHAVIEPVSGGFRVLDEGSTNGTFVGRDPVREASVGVGDIVRMGHAFFLLTDDGATLSAADGLRIPTFSGPFARELERLGRLAASPIPLVLLGETGTGKEVVARAVHDRSGRPGGFIAVNCGALPRELVESHLFGHARGAFSGAVRDEVGFVRAADGGTLFLDEIGDLPLSAQTALLRVLQEGEVTPVGVHRPLRVEVRVVAATHRPLDRMVAEGSFRADLYARLSGFVARLSPLRERATDLGLLLGAWIADRRIPDVSLHWDAALRMLEHGWTLNVRELLQTVQASALLAENGVVRAGDLPETLRRGVKPGGTSPSLPPVAGLSAEDAALREELAGRLEKAGGNLSQVAREMGKMRQQVQRWVRRFGLKKS